MHSKAFFLLLYILVIRDSRTVHFVGVVTVCKLVIECFVQDRFLYKLPDDGHPTGIETSSSFRERSDVM